ncbi:hypothetical protein BJ742DRAFT_799588 [Cladochytrium replicatum]|nr:hypothetical protein BJ742DRAFT_799588 [Cladochytrium replicatum]
MPNLPRLLFAGNRFLPLYDLPPSAVPSLRPIAAIARVSQQQSCRLTFRFFSSHRLHSNHLNKTPPAASFLPVSAVLPSHHVLHPTFRAIHSTLNRSFPPDPARPDDPRPFHSDYILNVGQATRTIRDELPLFFSHGLISTDIYHPNMTFYDPFHFRGTVHFKGLRRYEIAAAALRIGVNACYDHIAFDIVKIQQIRGDGGGDDGGDGEGGGGPTNVGDTWDWAPPGHKPGAARPDALQKVNYYGPMDLGVAQKFNGSPQPFYTYHTKPESSHANSSPHPSHDPSHTISFSPNPMPSQQQQQPEIRLLVRWIFEATPRIALVLNPDNPSRTFIEGVFQYRFDPASGRVIEHLVLHLEPPPRAYLNWRNSTGIWSRLWWVPRGRSGTHGGGSVVPGF